MCYSLYYTTYINTYIHKYIHACMHTYIHTCIHTYIHTYIFDLIDLELTIEQPITWAPQHQAHAIEDAALGHPRDVAS